MDPEQPPSEIIHCNGAINKQYDFNKMSKSFITC